MKSCFLCENEKCPNCGMDDWSMDCYDYDDDPQYVDYDEQYDEEQEWEDTP